MLSRCCCFFFFFNDTATTEIYTLSLHDALPIYRRVRRGDEREHRAVVRRVGLHVEQANAGDGRERRAEGLDGRVISTCGEVRHALDEGGGHGKTSTRNAEVGMRNREARVEPDDRLAVPRSAV